MKAIIIHRHGGVDVLEVADRTLPQDANSVAVQLHYAGVNFVDVYQREGRYPGIALPLHLGIEGSGIVQQAPPGSDWKAGDRVAFCTGAQGAYAEQISIAGAHLVRVPDALSLKLAAAAIEQGLTALMLADAVMRQGAKTALVHAGAGGVGGLLLQLLKAKGLRVFGTASGAEKLAWLGAQGVEALAYGEVGHESHWLHRVREHTSGKGVDVVFDSVGLSTFEQGLDALAVRGQMILFGAASGQIAPVAIARLMAKSLSLTRPVLPHFLADAQALKTQADTLFALISEGKLHLRIHATLPIEDVQTAHSLLESRATQGKLLLSLTPETEPDTGANA